MNKRSVFLFWIGVAFLSQGVFAAETIYHCQVLSDAYIKSNGELVLIQDSPRVGEDFTVIKKTGEVFGDVMDTLKNPKVIASGSAGNPYKVIWTQKAAGKNGAFVDYLSIEGFAKDGKHPFGFFSGALLMTGVCE
ncbi:hypothetical protein [Polynucleobacter sp. UB-Tiil-W10]|uniref:hypothetical protein n=1 Tax=Polynucleobacter sp. UB-Tiil-W10 TaxID=1855648 RepID=UPI001C0E4C2E|nr:hypothetical protein [Polynucleobacter sp. UB-Tiil-W10]MBU3539811.1 hypothetical protein [Polynucleobacter sp. UB-Tiil-W10]